MAKRDYYEVLGVEKGADTAAIKSAYRRLAMKYHPDRNPDDPGAESRFKEVQEAYACLSDEQKRAAYNRFGHSAFDGVGGGGGVDPGFSSFFEDVFSDFFGGGGGRGRGGGGRQRQQRVIDIKLSFSEMANGCEKKIRLTLPEECKECGGSGAAEGTKVTTCSTCGGAGQVRIQRSVFTVQQTCPTCHGEGRAIEHPCRRCDGSGRVNKTRQLEVNIPAGVEDGALIRVNLDSSDGDELYIRSNVAAHPLFVRDGDNLHIEIPVSIIMASLGGEVITPSVKTGGKLKVAVPAGVQNGQVLRVSGGGLPNARTGRRGNLMCHINVEVPVNLNSEQVALLRQLEASMKNSGNSPKEESWLDKIRQFFTD